MHFNSLDWNQKIITMLSTNIDHANIHLEYPELTKIHGVPTYPTLHILEDEIKSNEHSVVGSLGGGLYNHY